MLSAIITMMQGPLCGTLATMFFYGVICMQVFHYASTYGTSDRRVFKWLVGTIWALETVHTAFSFHMIEHYLILHFDDPEVLEYEVWSMGATYITGFGVALLVNFLYVWRIWQLGKQRLVCVLLAFTATARAALGVANAILGLEYREFPVFVIKVHPTIVAEWTLAAFTNTAIATTLCLYLIRQRSGIKRTDHIINTLLLYTINTGALTSLVAILAIVTFFTLPGITFSAFVQVQSKLYTVSILASLNARRRTLEGAQKAVSTINNVALTFGTRPVRYSTSQPSAIEFRKVEEGMLSASNTSCL